MKALLLGLLLSADAGAPASPVTAMLETQAQAWNRGDLTAFCAVYVDDAVFVSPSGITRGRHAVLERYQKRYPDQKAMGTLSFVFEDVRVDGDAASVIAEWKLRYPYKPEAKGHTLLSLRQKAGRWFIVHDASM